MFDPNFVPENAPTLGSTWLSEAAGSPNHWARVAAYWSIATVGTQR